MLLGTGAVTRQDCHQATAPGESSGLPHLPTSLWGAHGAGRAEWGGHSLSLPPACLPALSPSAVLDLAGGPWSLGPQATEDKGQIPQPWLWAIDPAQASLVGVGKPWPGQTAAPEAGVQDCHPLSLQEVSGGLRNQG